MNTKTKTLSDGDTFELYGLTFRFRTEHDSDSEPPWDDDCTGDVRELRDTSDKKPGERFLTWERGWGLAYDWQGAIKKALADGWGIAPERKAEWEARIDRKLTRGQIAEAAVNDDFNRLRAYCAGDWYYVGVIVELLDVDGKATGESDSVWRIESDSEEYQTAVAHDIAHTIASGAGLLKGKGKDKKANARKYITRNTGARFERIQVRA